MIKIEGFEHKVASHCESGSVRNLLNFEGVDISEPMAFGIGSGVDFIYLSFMKSFSPFPQIATRSAMGKIFKNLQKLCGINFFYKKVSSTQKALEIADRMIESGKPVAACVDMFYMKYLPVFMQIHVPFHFIILFGKDDEGNYLVSDPYHTHVGKLSLESLKAAWATNALFSNDNLLVYLKEKPGSINLKNAIKTSITKTANKMLIPGFIDVLAIMGINGMKKYADVMLSWHKNFKGLALREGILYTATSFEEQGTGGGAFRLIYGAFLHEAAKLFNSDALLTMAEKMIENGNQWRENSRDLIKIGKSVPRRNKDYPDWYAKNKTSFIESIQDLSQKTLERAQFEEDFFKEIKKIVKDLKD